MGSCSVKTTCVEHVKERKDFLYINIYKELGFVSLLTTKELSNPRPALGQTMACSEGRKLSVGWTPEGNMSAQAGASRHSETEPV